MAEPEVVNPAANGQAVAPPQPVAERHNRDMPRASWQRTAAGWVLIVVACTLVVLSVLAVGVQQLVFNTEHWVAVAAPLSADPTVQSSLADTAATLTLSALDLPDRVQSLPLIPAASIEAVVGTFVDNQALRLVQSPQFSELWVDFNRTAHQGLLQFLRGEQPTSDAITVTNGEVRLNLVALVPALLRRVQQGAPAALTPALSSSLNDAPAPGQLRQVLSSALGRQLPPDFGLVPVAQASTLVTIRQTLLLLDRITRALVAAALIAILATLVVSVSRRLAVLRLGSGVAIGMLVAGGALAVVQSRIASSLAAYPIGGAVEAVVDAVLTSLNQLLAIAFVVAAIIALVAFLAGPAVNRGVRGANKL